MIVVTDGGFSILEMLSRAKTNLIVILVEGEYSSENYTKHKNLFLTAAEQDLIIMS